MADRPLTKHERVAAANNLILQISSYGRRFFYSKGHDRVARFELAPDGKLWFRDDYTGKRCYTAYRYRWRHFSHGGTMRSLIDDLAAYIRHGERIRSCHLGPWPVHLCQGDLWGYGLTEMTKLRTAVQDSDCLFREGGAGAHP